MGACLQSDYMTGERSQLHVSVLEAVTDQMEEASFSITCETDQDHSSAETHSSLPPQVST